MVQIASAAAAAAAAVALLALNGAFAADRATAYHSRLAIRQSSSILQADHSNGDDAPGARDGDAAGQTIVINGNGGHDSNSQRAGCDTIFIGSAAVGGSFSSGWTSMPQVLGFDTKRDLFVDGQVVQPYIETTGLDASKVKRAIIVQPGLPRDFWKYSNLVRNSLLCASQNATAGIDMSTILIAALAWLTEADRSAGAGQDNDMYFSGGGWATGGTSSGPGNTKVSSFTVLDRMIAKYLDKSAYPAITSVYVVGHSLGGALSQRYAMLRQPTDDDANVAFFTGNPGAYVWPITDRPVDNPPDTSCASTRNDYSYGLSSLNSYAGSASRDDIASRYASRKVVYGLGLSDNEQGDTHCEAGYQGTSHLSRGQNIEKALATLPGGVPASHHFNYVDGVAHEDYLILSDPVSQYYLFTEGIDTRAGSSSSSASASSSASGTDHAASSASKSSSSASATGTGAASGSSGSSGALSTSKGGLAAAAAGLVGAAFAALL